MIWKCLQFSATWERSPANNPIYSLECKEVFGFISDSLYLQLLATLRSVGAVIRQKSHLM